MQGVKQQLRKLSPGKVFKVTFWALALIALFAFLRLFWQWPFSVYFWMEKANPFVPSTTTVDLQEFDPSEVVIDRSIFFVETSGSAFRGRRLCAFEAAARLHPHLPLFVLIM